MRFFTLASLFLTSFFSLHADPSNVATPPYNEVYDAQGKMRAPYLAYSRRIGGDPLFVGPQTFKAMSESPLGDKVKIYPVPLVLGDSEYAKIRLGTTQRARAFRAFFHDLFAGKQRFKGDLRFEALNEDLLNSVIKKTLPHANLKKMRDFWMGKEITKINFAYGPDLMRAKDEMTPDWFVVEDNIGVIGGLVDTDWVENAFYTAMGFTDLLAKEESFVGHALSEYLKELGIEPADAIGFFDKEHISHESEGTRRLSDDEILSAAWTFENDWFTKSDHEDSRLIRILRSMGIPLVDSDDVAPETFLKMGEERPQLVFESDAVSKWAKFLFFYRAIRENNLLEHFPAYGTTFLSSKIFLPFIEDFIRFYLNEEPILKTLPSRLVSDPKELVKIGTDLAEGNDVAYENKVFKHPDGAQGSNVAILSKMNRAQKATLGRIIGTQALMVDTAGVDHFGAPLIIQDELEPSHIPVSQGNDWLKLSIDMRPLTLVMGRQIRVRSRPWVRGAFQFGHSLNNVSQGAFELAALLESDCEAAAL